MIAALAVAAAVAASAAPPTIAFDPRVELLGVVQVLAGRRSSAPFDRDYRRAIEARFGAYRAHPAVALYRKWAAAHEEFGIDVLFYSPPPALELDERRQPPPYGDPQELARFIAALRDFSRDSGFLQFYNSQRPFYERLESAARAQWAERDAVAEISRYVGAPLDARSHYVLSEAYAPSGGKSFIVPYPDPPAGRGLSGPYDVYSILTPERLSPGREYFDAARGVSRGSALDELVWTYLELTLGPALERAGYGTARPWPRPLAGCSAAECVKGLVAKAIDVRLMSQDCPEGRRCADSWRPPRGLREVERALQRYERERSAYPTLASYYPALIDALSGR